MSQYGIDNMNDLDLTDAVEAAGKRLYTDYRIARLSSMLGVPGSEHAWEEFPEWGDLPVMDQHAWREQVRVVVIAAAPAIARSALATKKTPDA